MPGMKLASLWRRLAAIFYDSLVALAIMMVATALLLPFTGGRAVPPGTIIYDIYLVTVVYLYFAYCWRFGGQTLGMRAWKIRIVADGEVTWTQTFVRFFGAIPSILCLGLGLYFRWHDKWSQTKLVKF
jgi:uncharacterized RDD family membrane protein YckC